MIDKDEIKGFIEKAKQGMLNRWKGSGIPRDMLPTFFESGLSELAVDLTTVFVREIFGREGAMTGTISVDALRADLDRVRTTAFAAGHAKGFTEGVVEGRIDEFERRRQDHVQVSRLHHDVEQTIVFFRRRKRSVKDPGDLEKSELDGMALICGELVDAIAAVPATDRRDVEAEIKASWQEGRAWGRDEHRMEVEAALATEHDRADARRDRAHRRIDAVLQVIKTIPAEPPMLNADEKVPPP